MRIGLMGGTFDPIHYGHLVIAEVARRGFALERVVWVPAGDPPHKKEYAVTPAEHRYAMVVLATATHPAFEVSRLEIERDGPSFTIDTILHFREQLRARTGGLTETEAPDETGAADELFFITGADATLEILTWYRHSELIRACRFIAVTRPGYDLGRLSSVLPPEYLGRVSTITAPGVYISSTDIRRRLAERDTIKYLLPEPVEAYVEKHHLYSR